MAPRSRPTVMIPTVNVYEPASVPSARSAVRTTPLDRPVDAPPPTPTAAPVDPDASGAGAGWRAILKPQEAQNLLLGGLGCSHCGQMTSGPPPAAPTPAGAADA